MSGEDVRRGEERGGEGRRREEKGGEGRRGEERRVVRKQYRRALHTVNSRSHEEARSSI
jgi:hypothetical protein